MKFSILPLMRNRIARGAMFFLLALAVAFAAYRYGAYNSSEAKQARFRASVEKELQVMDPVVDSLKKSDIECGEKILKRFVEARKSPPVFDINGNVIPTRNIRAQIEAQPEIKVNCNSLNSFFFKSRYDSLNLYRKFGYDCKKMSDYFTITNRPERLPPYCKR